MSQKYIPLYMPEVGVVARCETLNTGISAAIRAGIMENVSRCIIGCENAACPIVVGAIRYLAGDNANSEIQEVIITGKPYRKADKPRSKVPCLNL